MKEVEILIKLKDEFKQELVENILHYWLNNTIDEINGGFVGTINCINIPQYDDPKGGILHSRILWTFSAAYKTFGNEEYKVAADRAYEYLKEHFIDKEHGGTFWLVDANGNPFDDRKHVYAQAFSIYSLAEYYLAVKDEEALNHAIDLYNLIEKHAAENENGGYFEAFSREWKLIEDVRLSDKDKNEPKSMNTHLHILEGYTNLYRAWPNAQLKVHLTTLVHIFIDNIVNESSTSMINFMDLDWTPKSDIISFGHDIETTWLLCEAVNLLDDKDLINKANSIAISVADSVISNGIDKDGGLLNEANSSGVIDTDKDWWPQAEAVIGFLNAYEIAGKKEFLQASYDSWSFIKSCLIDYTYGEWYEKVNKEGEPYKEMDKVRLWKGPYHNGRAALEVIERVGRLFASKKKLNKKEIA